MLDNNGAEPDLCTHVWFNGCGSIIMLKKSLINVILYELAQATAQSSVLDGTWIL